MLPPGGSAWKHHPRRRRPVVRVVPARGRRIALTLACTTTSSGRRGCRQCCRRDGSNREPAQPPYRAASEATRNTFQSRFTLHTDPDNTGGTSFSLDVVVHANVSAMRQAARRNDPNHCGGIAGAGGCFQAEPPGGRATHLGVVRLCAEYANPLVVIHEAEHAGVALAHKLAEGNAYPRALAPAVRTSATPSPRSTSPKRDPRARPRDAHRARPGQLTRRHGGACREARSPATDDLGSVDPHIAEASASRFTFSGAPARLRPFRGAGQTFDACARPLTMTLHP